MLGSTVQNAACLATIVKEPCSSPSELGHLVVFHSFIRRSYAMGKTRGEAIAVECLASIKSGPSTLRRREGEATMIKITNFIKHRPSNLKFRNIHILQKTQNIKGS